MKFMNGNSHLPADEEGLPEVMFTVLLLLVCFGVFVLYGVMSPGPGTRCHVREKNALVYDILANSITRIRL